MIERYVKEIKDHIDKRMDPVLVELSSIHKTLHQMCNINDHLDGDKLLDNYDLCMMLKVTNRTLYTYRVKGILRYTKKEKKIYYHSSDVHEFLKTTDRETF